MKVLYCSLHPWVFSLTLNSRVRFWVGPLTDGDQPVRQCLAVGLRLRIGEARPDSHPRTGGRGVGREGHDGHRTHETGPHGIHPVVAQQAFAGGRNGGRCPSHPGRRMASSEWVDAQTGHWATKTSVQRRTNGCARA